MGSSVPTIRFCIEAGPSYACSLQIDGSERARWMLPGRAPAELLDAFVRRHLGCGPDDARSGPDSLHGVARLSRDLLPGPLIDERRLDHLEERLKAADEPGAPPLVLGLEVDDELRDLPLEAGQLDPEFEHEGARSVCLDDRVVVARRGSGPGLVADSELRALVIDCGDGERLEQKSLEMLCGKSVAALSNPTYAELKDYLAEAHDHNVLVTIGHVEQSGWGKPASMTFGDGPQSCAVVASLVARSLPELKMLVLGGCESWSSLAPAFDDLRRFAAEHGTPEPVLTSIPVLVAHHFKVAPETERGAVTALLQELATSGRVDRAFRSYRGALGEDAICWTAMRSSAVLRLDGDNLHLVTRDTDQRKRLRYARAIRARYSRVRLPGDAKRDVETSRSRGGYLERDVTHTVKEKEEGQSEQTRQVREHEASILDRLLRGDRSVVGLKAPAGVGKTALVHNLAHRLATDYLVSGQGPLPVCVELRWYGTSLQGLVTRTLAEELTTEDLKSTGYVLLADGLDEAAGKERLREEIKTLPKSTKDADALPPPSASLISSRPESATADLPHFGRDREGKEEHIFELEPWDTARVGRYVAHHFEGLDKLHGEQLIQNITRNPALVRLAGQPLLLWMLCGQAETTPAKRLPSTATALLGAGVGRILRRRNEHLEPGQRTLGEGDMDLIAELCWARVNIDQGLTVRDARKVLRDAITSDRHDAWEVGISGEVSRAVVDDLLEDLVTRSGLLSATGSVREDETVLSPSDVRFGEFLVARHIANAINAEGWENATVKVGDKSHLAAQWASCRAWLPEIKATMAYLAGQLDEPGPMLEEFATADPTMLNARGDDYFRHRLAVAARCVGEIDADTIRRHQTIVDDITTQTMNLWWKHLNAGTDQMVQHHADQAGHLVNARSRWDGQCVLERLADSLLDPDKHTRQNTLKVVFTLGPNAATQSFRSHLFDCLLHADPDVRGCAVSAIGELGFVPGTDIASDRLVGVLRDDESQVRSCGSFAVGKLGPMIATSAFLDRIVGLLTDNDARVRATAAEAVGALGSHAATESIRDALVPLLWDDDVEVRHAVSWAVGRLGDLGATDTVLTRLAEFLRTDERSQSDALRAVTDFGAAAATDSFLSLLADLLLVNDDDVRYSVKEAVHELGAAAATDTFLHRLADLLCNDDWEVRRSVGKVLGELGHAAGTDAFLNRLAAILRDDDAMVSEHAAYAVGQLGSAAAHTAVLASLADLLTNDTRLVFGVELLNEAGATAVGQLGPAAATPTILKHLARLLQDDRPTVQQSAAEAVGAFGASGATSDILGILIELVRDEHSWVRAKVAGALGQLHPATATPAVLGHLTELLRDEQSHVRRSAAEAVGRFGEAAATDQILSRLADLLRDEESWVRGTAAGALGTIGPAAATEVVLCGLADLLGDKDSWVRRRVAEAVVQLGSAAATDMFVERLTEYLRDEDSHVRWCAAKAMEMISPDALTSDTVATLAELLGHDDSGVRSSAAEVVCGLSPAAASDAILGQLLGLLVDQHDQVRSSVAKALAGIAGFGVLFRIGEVQRTTPHMENRVLWKHTLGELGRLPA